MGLFKSIKKTLGKGKKKKRRGAAQGLQDPLADPLGGGAVLDPLDDAGVKKSKMLATATAAGSIQQMKYRRAAVGEGKTKRGFFKANADMEDPMIGMSSQEEAAREARKAAFQQWNLDRRAAKEAGEPAPARPDPAQFAMSQDVKHMAARAVMSSRVDKALGTDVLTDERFAVHDGQTGVSSMMAEGEALRSDRLVEHKDGGGGNEMTWLDVDLSRASTQKSLSDLQVNDYLTGQVDRHAGNMFYDDKTGRVRGIDNDLAFGDQFNEQFTSDDALMAKHVKHLPKFIDLATAQRILDMDLLDYFEMLGGNEGDLQRLTPDEQVGAFERLSTLQDHVQALMDKREGKDVDAEGQIVDEWNQDTFDAQVADEGDSYLKRTAGSLQDARDNPGTYKKTKKPKKKKKGLFG